jgi:hypothetical protein
VLFVNVDLSDIADLLDIEGGLKSATKDAARDLAAMVQAKATELAATKLHARRDMFVKGLSLKQVNEETWLVSLDAKIRWIDDGQSSHNMLDKLLASSKAKRAKDGSKYVVVPFDHSPGRGPSTTTSPQQDLISTIKSELKKRGIPFGKIETDAAGQALTGRLHSFDIMTAPTKSSHGPGQGKGPLGASRQGPTGIPFLQGVTVYQNKGKDGKVRRQVMTFRIASSKHQGQGRWEHPGNHAVNIMEDAAKWALETWEKEVAPALIDKVILEMGG